MAFDELFNVDRSADRHRATLWWGTHGVVFGQLYARRLELQQQTMTEEAQHGSYISADELQHMHAMAVIAATLVHDGPPVLPRPDMFARTVMPQEG